MGTRQQWGGPMCPTDPAHGGLMTWEGIRGYFCPHSFHDGIKDGNDPPPSAWFTRDQVEAAEAARYERPARP